MHVNYDPFIRDMVKIRAFHSEAIQESTIVIGGQWLRRVNELSSKHHDTNRYINGYILAAHDIGYTEIPVKPYRASHRREMFLQVLMEQYDDKLGTVERLLEKIDWYKQMDAAATPRLDGKPRKKRTRQPYYRKLLKALKKAQKRLDSAAGELIEAGENEHAVFFFGRKGRVLKSGKTGRSRLASVRGEIYGGRGTVELIGNRVFVTFENLEPHTRLVERKPKIGHPARTAMSELRFIGVRRASKRYMEVQAEKFGRRLLTPAEVKSLRTPREGIQLHA